METYVGEGALLRRLLDPACRFTGHEVEQARGVGASVVSLGPRILRAETAAIVSAALVLAREEKRQRHQVEGDVEAHEREGHDRITAGLIIHGHWQQEEHGELVSLIRRLS